jgi:chromosome segregation ATPase
MTDADKILHALSRLEAGQQAMQKDITSLQSDVKGLKIDVNGLQEGQAALQKTVGQQGNALVDLQAGQKALQTDVKLLKEGQETLDFKVEAFHAEQTMANTQILTMLTDMNEINAKAIDTRVTQIEKHLNLPPIK